MKAIIAVPATAALVYRAWRKKSLTPGGLVAAALTAAAHAVHPWNLPFALLVIFFLAGTRATHNVKAGLTLQATGAAAAGEGPRTHVQVLANSLVASVLTLLHAYQLHQRRQALVAVVSGTAETTAAPDTDARRLGSLCYSWRGDLLVIGIVANYAAVAADTFSSELGILSTATPRLITSPTLRRVPRGTNGGVTLLGLGAGLLGSVVVVTGAMLFLPLCTDASPADARLFQTTATTPWTAADRRVLMAFLAVWGLLGSVLDSVLGALFQSSVKDVRSGKIVEGDGGVRVLVASVAKGAPSRVVENGWDLLDNNDVNFLTALTMSLSAMGVASWYWDVPLADLLKI